MKISDLKKIIMTFGSALALVSGSLVTQAVYADGHAETESSIYARLRVHLNNQTQEEKNKSAGSTVETTTEAPDKNGMGVNIAQAVWGFKHSHSIDGATLSVHYRPGGFYQNLGISMDNGVGFSMGKIGTLSDDWGYDTDLVSMALTPASFIGFSSDGGDGLKLGWSGDVGGGSLSVQTSMLMTDGAEESADNSIDDHQYGVKFSNDMLSVAVWMGVAPQASTATDSHDKKGGDASETNLSLSLKMVPNLSLVLAHAMGEKNELTVNAADTTVISGTLNETTTNITATIPGSGSSYNSKMEKSKTTLAAGYTVEMGDGLVKSVVPYFVYAMGTRTVTPLTGTIKKEYKYTSTDLRLGVRANMGDGLKAGFGYISKSESGTIKVPGATDGTDDMSSTQMILAMQYDFSNSF